MTKTPCLLADVNDVTVLKSYCLAEMGMNGSMHDSKLNLGSVAIVEPFYHIGNCWRAYINITCSPSGPVARSSVDREYWNSDGYLLLVTIKSFKYHFGHGSLDGYPGRLGPLAVCLLTQFHLAPIG